MLWHPLRFIPIYQERVWGGRSLATRFGRNLPGHAPIGESWELCDRAEGISVVAEGPLAGHRLNDLVARDPSGLLGVAPAREGRFPLLVKILDARAMLSLQVHPPARIAPSLGGEPKSELWYFTDADPGAEILAGLRPGCTRETFETGISTGSVADCFHHQTIRAGDALFLPSGRVHALGAGLVLFEIQENSNTTYRVFDWNRVGLDGQPRQLHVPESLASIDFEDFAPSLLPVVWKREGAITVRSLVTDPLFRVEVRRAPAGTIEPRSPGRCQILGLVRGDLIVSHPAHSLTLGAGDFCLLPAGLEQVRIEVRTEAEWLVAEPGPGRQRSRT